MFHFGFHKFIFCALGQCVRMLWNEAGYGQIGGMADVLEERWVHRKGYIAEDCRSITS